jgi:MFS family permease
VSYGDVFCNPLYRKATFVGISLSIVQMGSGINAIMFYSNTIFANGTNLTGNQITALVGIVNFISTLGGMALLGKFGRRTLMVWTNLPMGITLVVLGFCSLQALSTPVIALTMLYIALFEFGTGPVTWLYMSEIMQDKAVSLATVVNQIVSLVISAVIPPLIKLIGEERIGYIFIAFGVISGFGYLFIVIFMHETMGKTSIEI